jgi:hypothetical protein
MVNAVPLDEIGELATRKNGTVVRDQHLWQPQCGESILHLLDCGL